MSTPSKAMTANTTTGVSPQRLVWPGMVKWVVMAMASPSRKTAMAALRLPGEASMVADMVLFLLVIYRWLVGSGFMGWVCRTRLQAGI
ncbi:hypothetical protein D3C72_1420670 [compost metagenome]